MGPHNVRWSRSTSLPMERMSSLDGVFLAVEESSTTMNIGSVGIFEGPAPQIEELRKVLVQRISGIRRLRQRVHMPKGPLGRPVWIDDTTFDIANHVLELASLDRTTTAFTDRIAELLTIPLDRNRPLWRVWFAPDSQDDTWTLVVLAHHCMLDGVAGSDLLGAILTREPQSVDLPIEEHDPLHTPTKVSLMAFQILMTLQSLGKKAFALLRAVRHPRASIRTARHIMSAAEQLWFHKIRTTTSLVGPHGSTRRWERLSIALEDLGPTQAMFDCTVNDIVLAAITHGFRSLLVQRGESVEGRTVTAMVPVSLRRASERGSTGNRVANVHALLPVGEEDPQLVLSWVQQHLKELKNSHQTEATGMLMRIGDYLPRFISNRVARAVFRRQRNVEIVVTNVPGPVDPLYCGSRRMIEAHPVPPIGGLVRTTVAIWSYCGMLHIGVTADRDSTPDIECLTRGIARGFEEILGRPHGNPPPFST